MDPFLDSIKCKSHPDNDIIYICQSRSCRVPLCLRCLKEHSSFHKAHKTNLSIVTLTEFKKQSKDKLSHTIDHFLGEIKSFEQYYLLDIDLKVQSYISEAEACRENLLNIINNFFENFRLRMHNHLTEMRGVTQSNVLRGLENMKKLLAELNNLFLCVGHNFEASALESLMRRDFIEEFDELKNKAVARFEKMTLVDLKVNNHLLPDFAQKLNEVIAIEQKPFEISRPNESLARKKPDFSKEYFESHSSQRILHFFQDSTKLLKFIDLDELIKSDSKSYCFEEINLDIEFDIPTWHKSVITPQGRLYITGGLDAARDNLELSDCYEMDFLEKKIKPIAKLNKARYGHEMVYSPSGLYVLGGSNDSDGMLDHCEQFAFPSGKWREIARLNKKAFGPAACVWEDKYIYKFGGLLEDKVLNNTIERYSMSENKWEVLEYELVKDDFALFPEDFIIPWCAGISLINASQIFVFGGYSANNDNSQQSFIFTINTPLENSTSMTSIPGDSTTSEQKKAGCDKKHCVTHVNKWFLPVGEGFWDSHGIIIDSKLFCLQNIQVEEYQSSTKPDVRRLLIFGDYKWRLLDLDEK